MVSFQKQIDKLIFLDFDGVLTSVNDGTSYLCLNNKYGISENCANKLDKLIRDTGSKIIIASNWRRYPPDGYWFYKGVRILNPMEKLFDRFGKHIMGALPINGRLRKAEELRIWFRETGFSGKYAIFDDDGKYEMYFGSEFESNFIDTCPQTGLTDMDCDQARKLLT